MTGSTSLTGVGVHEALWMHDASESAARHHQLVAEHGPRVLVGIGVSHAPLIDQLIEPGRYRRPTTDELAMLRQIGTPAGHVDLDSRPGIR